MQRSIHPSRLMCALCAVLILNALGCKPKPDETVTEKTEATDSWRKQSVALQVTGFSLNGGEVKQSSWVGSGVFIAPGIIATNAHVAARGLQIQGRDDTNRPHVFDKILAIDMANDLAILKADYVNEDVIPATLLERPADPKSLRQTKILAVGNTGGLGLSTYSGQITNVVEEGSLARILHDGQIAGGSSGGPLFKEESFELLGINHATNSKLNTSLAIPSWIVTEWLEKRGGAAGIPLKSAFMLSGETSIMNEVKRDVCLKPGEAINVPVTYSNGLDFLNIIAPKNPAQPVIYGMGAQTAQGLQYFDKGILSKQVIRAFTTPIAAQYVLTIGAPPQATAPTCVAFVIGQINWGNQINNK